MPTPHLPTFAARRAIKKLGADIKEARIRRRLPMALLAERALTSRATLQRIEEGDVGVSIGIVASVLHSLSLLEGLTHSAEHSHDVHGQLLARSQLPKRAYRKRSMG